MVPRSSPVSGEAVSFGPFRLLASSRALLRDGSPVMLGSRALDLLILLVERAGDVVSTRTLLDHVWPNLVLGESNLRFQIAGLRKALGDGRDGARYIVNVPGRGYCFVAPVSRSATLTEPRVPVGPRPSAGPGKLPPQLTAVIGREEITAALQSLVLSRRFISVVGPGGIGKTTVAMTVAHALLGEFDGEVFFVDLAAIVDPELVPIAVGTAISLSAPAGDPIQSLVAYLANSRVLLVLDNCEHLIEAVAVLAETLFRGTPDTHLLATSREVLRARGEHVYLLAPLACPADTPELTAAQALGSPAAQLFMERARASGYDAVLTDGQVSVVAGLCRSLDGLALAIELAASQVGAYGVQGVADLLTRHVELLGPGRRTATPRHRTLQATLDWSYGLLPACEQQVLRRLSMFVGPFTLRAAEWVAGEGADAGFNVLAAIGNLVSKSLISVSSLGEHTQYRLLYTTRIYASGRLAEARETDAIARRHASWLAIWLVETGGNRDATLYSPHVGDIRSALEWSFSDAGDVTLGVELASQSAMPLTALSLLGECQRWCERALTSLPSGHHGTERELALVTGLAISSMFMRGNGEEVRAAIERGLALAEALGEQQLQVQLLAGLNIFLTRIADFRGALAAAERSARIAEELARVPEIAAAESMLSAAHHLVGNQVAAKRHSELSLQLMPASGIARRNIFGYDHRARALVSLARALWVAGLPEQALEVAHAALDEADTQGHAVTGCITLIAAAQVLIWCGRLEQAGECATRLSAHAAKHSLSPYRAIGIGLKGEVVVAQGDREGGVDLLRQALATLDAERHHWLATRLHRALAEGLSGSGRPEAARASIDRALVWAERAGGPFDMPDLLRTRGEILSASREPDLPAAEEALQSSLRLARSQSALSWELRTSIALARLWVMQGRGEKAGIQLSAVYDRFTEGFSTTDLRVARGLLGEIATSQPNGDRPTAVVPSGPFLAGDTNLA